MSDRAPAPSPEILLAHLEWIRRLARELVRDGAAAEDLAQDACLVALRHPEHEGPRFRAWIAAVMRNAARRRARRAKNQSERERRTARAEALESTARLVERVSVERELVGAVLELDEPLRTAVLLRYFENLPSRDIAERTGASIDAVHGRLARGLERLRTRLDRIHGERSHWCALLLPLARLETPSTSTSFGALVLNAKVLVVLALSLGLAATAVVLALRESPIGAQEERRTTDAISPTAQGAELASETALERGRTVASEGEPSGFAGGARLPDAPAASHRMPRRVRGRVFADDGAPLSGIEVAVRDAKGREHAKSGAGGEFELTVESDSGEIVPVGDRWLPIRSGTFSARTERPSVVVIGPAIEIAGRIVDTTERVVPNARIAWQVPFGFEARFDDPLETSRTLDWTARSDANGAFELGRVPRVAEAVLSIVADGYLRLDAPLPLTDARELVYRLSRPPEPLAGAVRGRVLLPNGRGASEARVALGLTSVLTDGEGRFAIALGRAVTADTLTAVKSGHQPARMERPEEPREHDSGWPEHVELVLGPPPLELAGIVVDHMGEPRPGLRVWVHDTTPFGTIGRAPFSVEGLLSGDPVPPQVLATEPEEGARDGDDFTDWRTRMSRSTALWSFTKSDAEGRFVLRGLTDRKYRIEVIDEATLARHVSEPLRAGERDARIRLPAPDLWPLVAGQVRSDSGRPMAAVEVRLEVEARGLRGRVFGGRTEILFMQPRESVTTDAEGRFAFRDVPRGDALLTLQSDAIVPADLCIGRAEEPTQLEARVYTRCRVQVELEAPVDRADAFGFRDAEGRTIDVLVLSTNSVSAYTTWKLARGRSEVVSVSSAARTLVLWKGETTVAEVAIELAPDGVNRIAP